jgi:hypothetical protein
MRRCVAASSRAGTKAAARPAMRPLSSPARAISAAVRKVAVPATWTATQAFAPRSGTAVMKPFEAPAPAEVPRSVAGAERCELRPVRAHGLVRRQRSAARTAEESNLSLRTPFASSSCAAPKPHDSPAPPSGSHPKAALHWRVGDGAPRSSRATAGRQRQRSAMGRFAVPRAHAAERFSPAPAALPRSAALRACAGASASVARVRPCLEFSGWRTSRGGASVMLG